MHVRALLELSPLPHSAELFPCLANARACEALTSTHTCTHVHACTCTHVHTRVHVSMHARVHVHVHAHLHVRMHVQACMHVPVELFPLPPCGVFSPFSMWSFFPSLGVARAHVRTCTRACTCTCKHMHINTCTCVHTYVCVYTCTSNHAHGCMHVCAHEKQTQTTPSRTLRYYHVQDYALRPSCLCGASRRHFLLQ
jgi:hypothetical protein